GVLVEQHAAVVGPGVEVVGLHDLDVVGVDEQRGEQQQHRHRDPADRPVHSFTTWVRASSGAGGAGGAGRRTASLIRRSSAMRIQFATRLDPPRDKNGVVSPVSGISLVTPPTTMNTCSPRLVARPAASSLPNGSRASRATRRPRSTTRPYTTIRAI